ncbi:MAG: hypothetical protein QF691_00915 [SAR324 cluster bacterium]|nr:hypothetical protein [SAR324 cluster bacterium]
MHIASDILLVGFPSPNTYTFTSILSILSFCAEPNGEVAESIIQKITLALQVRGDLRRQWMGARQKYFLPPLIRLVGIFSRGRRFSSAY